MVRKLTGFLCSRSVWECHVEEGFSRGPAGVGHWLFLPWQRRPAGDSAVYQPAKHPVIVSEPEQPPQCGAGHLCCLGDPDNSADPAVEQSGSRVSWNVSPTKTWTGLFTSPSLYNHFICVPPVPLQNICIDSAGEKKCVISPSSDSCRHDGYQLHTTICL